MHDGKCVASSKYKQSLFSLNEVNMRWALTAQSKSVFFQISRVLINKSMPVRLEMPSSLIYFSVFGFLHPAHMSVSLEYITMMKHETLPMCERVLKEMNDRLEEEMRINNDEDGDVELVAEIAVAGEQVEDGAKGQLKAVTMDIWSVLASDAVSD